MDNEVSIFLCGVLVGIGLTGLAVGLNGIVPWIFADQAKRSRKENSQ